MLQGRGELKTTTTKKQILVITNFTKSTVNGGHIGRLNVHARNYFAFFYSFELKLCRMVELCISKKITFFFFVFRFFVFWRENGVTRLAAKVKFQDMTKQINNLKRARRDRIKFVFFLKKKAQLVKELLGFDF